MKYICSKCIPEKGIKNWIRKYGKKGTCSFCACSGIIVQIHLLANKIYHDIRREYRRCFSNSDDLEEKQSLHILLQKLLHIDDSDILLDIFYNFPPDSLYQNVKDGEENFLSNDYFDNDYKYTRRYGYRTFVAFKHKDDWKRFSNLVKHQSRSFNNNHKIYLDKLFSELDRLSAQFNFSLTRRIRRGKIIFRGRLAENEEDAQRFSLHAAKELDAPTKEKMSANRLNGAGVRTFYGAFDEDTCVAELRPGLKEFIVIGKFKLMRPLTVLDFSYVDLPKLNTSIFRDDYEDRWRLFVILKELQREIARPIRTTERLWDYIPTQVLAEYIKEVRMCDAIQYTSSVIMGSKATNIAILKETHLFTEDMKQDHHMENKKLSH